MHLTINYRGVLKRYKPKKRASEQREVRMARREEPTTIDHH
jgi:hypothetical protein